MNPKEQPYSGDEELKKDERDEQVTPSRVRISRKERAARRAKDVFSPDSMQGGDKNARGPVQGYQLSELPKGNNGDVDSVEF